MLILNYPAIYVPPSLPKQLTGKRKDETLIKHQRFLQRFMHAIISHPLLKRSPFITTFLKEDDELVYDNFKKETIKIKRPETVSNVPTLEGLADCDASNSQEYSRNLNEYLTNIFNIQKNIKRQSNKLEDQLKSSALVLHKLAESIKELEKAQELLPNNHKNTDVFRLFSQTMASWARSDLERIKTVKEYMSSFYKYTYNEVLPFKDIIKDREICYQTYVKAEKKIRAKKEKLWAQGDVSK